MLPQLSLLGRVSSSAATRRLLTTLVASHAAGNLHFALRKSVLPTHLPSLSSLPLLNTPSTPIHALPSSCELYDGRAMISRPRMVSSTEHLFTSLPEPETYDGPAWTQNCHAAGDALLITQFTLNVPSKHVRAGRRA